MDNVNEMLRHAKPEPETSFVNDLMATFEVERGLHAIVIVVTSRFFFVNMCRLSRIRSNTVVCYFHRQMPLPVRFIFFLVGPHDASEDYNETGRAFATIMSTPVRPTVDCSFAEVWRRRLMAVL